MTYITKSWVLLKDLRPADHDEGQLSHLHRKQVESQFLQTSVSIVQTHQTTDIFTFVTTAITSSCKHALNKKVTKAAWNLDNLYADNVDAQTCRSSCREKINHVCRYIRPGCVLTNVCTGLFHFLENSSKEIEFHLINTHDQQKQFKSSGLHTNPRRIVCQRILRVLQSRCTIQRRSEYSLRAKCETAQCIQRLDKSVICVLIYERGQPTDIKQQNVINHERSS